MACSCIPSKTSAELPFLVLIAGAIAGFLVSDALHPHVQLSYTSEVPDLSTATALSSYLDVYQPAAQVCTKDGRNVVLDRYTRKGLLSSEHFEGVRPWSLHPESYQILPNLRFCTSPTDLLQSVKLGRRKRWDSENPNGTYFEPFGCNYRWYTPSEMCEIGSRFSSVHLIGDSLSRHHMQGIYMLLTGDLVYGALPRFSRDEIYGNCTCDGQFSEHLLCRNSSTSRDMFQMRNSHVYGMCSLVKPFSLHYGYSPEFKDLCSPDGRPSMVLIEGGVHKKTNVSRAIHQIVKPVMDHLRRALRDCSHALTVYVLWSGMPSQPRWMDKRYPHQSSANASIFNQAMSHYVLNKHNISTLDFFNLSRDAASSDGFHLLTEANLLKALYLYNLMDLYTQKSSSQRSEQQ